MRMMSERLCAECAKAKEKRKQEMEEPRSDEIMRIIHSHPCQDCGGFYLSYHYNQRGQVIKRKDKLKREQ